jgi:hypothetical protein
MSKRKPADFQLAKRMTHSLDRLRWMLEFARLDFEDVTAPEGAAVLQHQIFVFITGQTGYPVNAPVRELTPERRWEMRKGLQVRISSYIKSSPDNPIGWKSDEGLTRRVIRGKDGAPHVIPIGTIEQIFFDCAQSLVSTEGKRIAKCARSNCDNFLVLEGRTTYCSKSCSQYVRTNKWRRKEAENV